MERLHGAKRTTAVQCVPEARARVGGAPRSPQAYAEAVLFGVSAKVLHVCYSSAPILFSCKDFGILGKVEATFRNGPSRKWSAYSLVSRR